MTRRIAEDSDGALLYATDVARAFEDLASAFRDMAREYYRERGAPYGDTEDGLSQWIAEHPCWLDEIAAGRL